MPRSLTNIVRLRPPFGGLDLNIAARSIHALDAREALNVIPTRGGIEVRPPARSLVSSALAASYGGPFLSVIHSEPTSGLRKYWTAIYSSDGTTSSYWFLRANELRYVHSVSEAANRPGFVYAAPFMYGITVGAVILGAMPKFLMDGNLTVYRTGILAPASAPVLAATTGSLVAAQYSYRYTLINDYGTESGPSPEAKLTLAAPGGITITFSLGSDPQVTKARIYRMQIDTDDSWYVLTETGVSPFTDDGSLPFPKLFDQRLNLTTGTPPLSYAAAMHKGRVWYAPADDAGALLHSDLFRYEQVDPLNRYGCGGDDSEQIRCLISSGAYLLAILENSIWAISGDGPESFVAELLIPQIGSSSRMGAVWAEGALYTADDAGVHEISGERVITISEPIWPLWRSLAVDLLLNLSLSYWAEKRLLIVCLPTDTQFVFNLERRKWSQWNFPALALGVVRPYSPVGHARPVFVRWATDPDTNRLSTVDPESSDWRDWFTDPIAYLWTSGDLDLGLSHRKKFFYAKVGWERGAAADAVYFAHKVNQGGAWVSVAGALNDAEPLKLADVSAEGETIALKISGNATTPTSITSLEIDAEPIGYR